MDPSAALHGGTGGALPRHLLCRHTHTASVLPLHVLSQALLKRGLEREELLQAPHDGHGEREEGCRCRKKKEVEQRRAIAGTGD